VANEPFVFHTERRLVALTGTSVANVNQLLDGVLAVPGSSIFYHTHHRYLAHHFQKPLFYNDFATWAADALQEDALAEQLAAIDLLAFTSVRQLREAIAEKIRAHLNESAGARDCRPEDKFYFCRSKSFILPTSFTARSIAEFFEMLAHATNASLYFHFFEARLRLGKGTNDFSLWLTAQGANDMADAIDKLDPYIRTLDELKADILEIGRREAA
jgi:Family of unknown function (DUF5752)